MPVLVVAGSLDAKFAGLAERIHDAVPGSALAVVPGAGHSVHLERPSEFVAALTTWLDVTPG